MNTISPRLFRSLKLRRRLFLHFQPRQKMMVRTRRSLTRWLPATNINDSGSIPKRGLFLWSNHSIMKVWPERVYLMKSRYSILAVFWIAPWALRRSSRRSIYRLDSFKSIIQNLKSLSCSVWAVGGYVRKWGPGGIILNREVFTPSFYLSISLSFFLSSFHKWLFNSIFQLKNW